jgi:hypothetical protein
MAEAIAGGTWSYTMSLLERSFYSSQKQWGMMQSAYIQTKEVFQVETYE